MKKKCLMLIMAGIMCFNFVGCASKETEVNSNYDVQEALDKYKEKNEKENENAADEETFVEIEGTLIESEDIEGEIYTYNIEIYETENQEKQAVITVQKDTDIITTLTVENDEWGDEIPNLHIIIDEYDVNFDGNQDILVNLGKFGEQHKDTKYKCYIANTEGFEDCSGFEMIDNPDIYSETRMIVGHAYSNSGMITYNRYEYINNSIKKIDSIELTDYFYTDEILLDIMFNREQTDIKAAYQYIIDSYKKIFNECKYDLIFFDNDDIPELVVGLDGYFSSMYTFSDGKIYYLIHNWSYGACGNYGYEYKEKSGIIHNYNSDYAGLVGYSTYLELSDDHNIEFKYYLKTSYEDENGNVIMDAEEFEDDNWKYYYSTDEKEQILISKSEYESYDVFNIDEYKSITGQYTEEEVMERLSSLENIKLINYGIEDKADYEKIIQQSINLDEDTYVDIVEWVDPDEGLLRVSVCSKEQQNELGILHKGDYFYYENNDEIDYFYISYSYDSEERMIWMEPTFECILDDVNFDGKKDLLINLGKNGMSELDMFCLYIKNENGYEYCSSFEQICSYSLDEDNQYVLSNMQDGYVDYYQYKDGEFVKVQP